MHFHLHLNIILKIRFFAYKNHFKFSYELSEEKAFLKFHRKCSRIFFFLIGSLHTHVYSILFTETT